MPLFRSQIPDAYLEQLALLKEITFMSRKEATPVYERVVNVMPIGKDPFLNLSEVVGTGLFADKTEGGYTPQDTFYQGYDKKITPTTKGLKIVMSKEAFYQDNFGITAKVHAALGRSETTTIETQCAAMFYGGFDTYTVASGQYLFSTSHPLPRGGTFANRLSAHVDLGYTNIQLLLNLFDSMVEIEGMYLDIEPKQIIFPTGLQFAMNALFASDKRYDLLTNETNTVKNLTNIELIKWKYLNGHDDNAFYLSAGPKDIGVYLVEGMPFEIESDYDVDKKVYINAASYMNKEACYHPYGLVATAGTS